jgi:hypothetical protein
VHLWWHEKLNIALNCDICQFVLLYISLLCSVYSLSLTGIDDRTGN